MDQSVQRVGVKCASAGLEEELHILDSVRKINAGQSDMKKDIGCLMWADSKLQIKISGWGSQSN